MIDHSSERRFSTGVPVSAMRNSAFNLAHGLGLFGSGFLMFWASSKMTASQ